MVNSTLKHTITLVLALFVAACESSDETYQDRLQRGSSKMMQDDMAPVDAKYRTRGKYPYYEKGDQLPPGMTPPLDTHSNFMMAHLATEEARVYLKASGIDNAMVDETVRIMFSAINLAFEKDFAEFTISKYVHQEDDEAGRRENIERLADHYAALTGIAAGKSLEGSPLSLRDFSFFKGLMDSATSTVMNHILLLNNQKALEEFRSVHVKELIEQDKLRKKLNSQ